MKQVLSAATALTLLAALPVSAASPREAAALEQQAQEAKQAGNFEDAAKYLEQAAETGYLAAQVDYANMLETGPRQVQNLVEAYAWYAVVASHPDSAFAEAAQERIKAKMPPADQEKAENRATELVNRYGM